VTTEGKPNVMLWFLYQYVYHLLVLSSVTREYHSGVLELLDLLQCFTAYVKRTHHLVLVYSGV